MADCWWLAVLPYQVIGPDGTTLCQSLEEFRYPPRIEQAMADNGCTIVINGKKLIQKELRKRGSTKKTL